jgi:hypothetical protein
VKREVTKVESYTEKMGDDLLLKLGDAQLRGPTNIYPSWVVSMTPMPDIQR